MGKPEGEVRRYHSDALPFAVEAYIDTYHGPAWVKRQLRGRSGWLQVSQARLTTDISDWSSTIVAGMTDDGDRLGQMTANAFLAMRTSGPQTCFDDPPDALADYSEMLFWDFLGRCDLRHLDMLEDAEAELAARLETEQRRGESVLGDAERYIADLQRRRRAPGAVEDRQAIAARIALMEDKHVAASAWLVRHLARLREQGQAFEADVMAALENHGEVEELYTIGWVARSQYDRFVDRGLLRELTTTGSLEGVPRRARLDKHDLWEIEEAQRQKPALTIEHRPRQKKRRAPEPKPVEAEIDWRREERELLAALEEWQAEKAGLDAAPTIEPDLAPSATFPPEALTPTTPIQPAVAALDDSRPVAPAPDGSIDIDALIENDLRDMLKDLT